MIDPIDIFSLGLIGVLILFAALGGLLGVLATWITVLVTTGGIRQDLRSIKIKLGMDPAEGKEPRRHKRDAIILALLIAAVAFVWFFLRFF